MQRMQIMPMNTIDSVSKRDRAIGRARVRSTMR